MKGAAEAHPLLCSSGSVWVPGIVVGSGSVPSGAPSTVVGSVPSGPPGAVVGSGSVWAPVRSSVLVLVPLGPLAWSSVLVPSGPPRGCRFWFCLGPRAVVGSGSGSVGAPARSSVLVLVPSGPPEWSSQQFSSSTCGLVGCLAGCIAARSQAWRPSLHSAGSRRAAPVQGRPPGAPLPRLSGQLPDCTVPRGCAADVSSQNR